MTGVGPLRTLAFVSVSATNFGLAFSWRAILSASAYQSDLQALTSELHHNGARPVLIDRYLSSLLDYASEKLAEDLLPLLSDDAEFQEGMWSILHAAETAPQSAYISATISVFPVLARSAPDWASVVLMRLLNEEDYRTALVRRVRDASALEKQAFRLACERINRASPEFLAKTVALTIAAGNE